MKIAVLFLALFIGARATPYLFTITGTADNLVFGSGPFAIGETFTAEFLVNPDVTDSTPADPVLGRYFHANGANIHFSGGFSLADQAFEYRVVDSGFSPIINATLDALIFNLMLPGYSLAFAYRFTPDTWANDFAMTPIITPFTPDSVGGLLPAEMLYYSNSGYVGGTITSTAVSTQEVPEDGRLSLLLLSLTGFALFIRHRRR